jgi:hypothetical protein
VLDELRAGTGLAVGSGHDARPYLVMVATASRDLVEASAEGWEALMARGAERDLALAMLRPERRLVGPGDARALALDPLAPAELVAQLGRLRPRAGADRATLG